MVKVYKGSNIVMGPPPEGWGILVFSDAYKCQVGLSKMEKKDGKEVISFYLKPHEALIKKFKIDVKGDLDRQGYCWKSYPIEMVRLLNAFDPSRRVYFCLLNYEGKDTENTDWFLGKEQCDEIGRLKTKIRGLMAHNEELKNENFIMKHNEKKHIKDQMEGVMNPLLPFIKGMLDEGAKKEET